MRAESAAAARLNTEEPSYQDSAVRKLPFYDPPASQVSPATTATIVLPVALASEASWSIESERPRNVLEKENRCVERR